MTFTLSRGGGGRWGGGVGKNEMLANVLDVQSLFFFIKESWIWAMTRHHADNILLTRNLPFD